MPTFTPNLNLKKPLQTENYNIDDFNVNADLLDTAFNTIGTNKSDKLLAGTNILLTPDLVNKTVTVAVSGKVANSVNADTATVATSFADGKKSSDFAPNGYGLGASKTLDNIDINTIKNSGFYYALPTCSNVPRDAGWSMLYVNGVGAESSQLIISITQNKTYFRMFYGTTWYPWKEFATVDQIPAQLQISILTGTVENGATIPLPSGYTQAQCKWMVSINNMYDSSGGGYLNCSTDANRVVTVLNTTGGAGRANYIIIGVK